MKIIQQTKKDYKVYTVEHIKIEPPLPVTTEHVVMGVDPGTTKLGLAYIWKSICHVYEVSIVRDDNPLIRILLTQDILSECLFMFDYAPIMIIEGSSFNGYRQTELAEVRTSAALWAINKGIKPYFVNPLTIRKSVFGNGKIKAEEQWAELPPDAASALACCYYAILLS